MMRRFTLLMEDDVPEGQRTGVWRYTHEVAARVVRAGRAKVVPVSLQGPRGLGWSLWYTRATMMKFLIRPSGPIHTMCPWFTPPETDICTLWDVIPLSNARKRLLDRVAYREFFRAIREYPSEWVTLTEPTRQLLISTLGLPRGRVHLAPPGVDTHMFRPLGGDHHDGRRTTVLHIGIGMPRKGVDTIIEALAILGPERFRFVRAGPVFDQNSAYMDSCRRRTREVGLEMIELGRVSDNELVTAYNDADLVIFPSMDEGAGMPPVEAMACGTNVVVSDIQPHRYMCGSMAHYARPGDPADLARAVEQALANPFPPAELRQLASQFSWDATADLYARLYDQYS